MEILPHQCRLEPVRTTCNADGHQFYFMASRRVNRAKHSIMILILPPEKCKSSSFQGTTGSWETNGSSRASHFTPPSLWQKLHADSSPFYTNKTEQEKTQNARAPTTCSPCWQVQITPLMQGLSRKHRRALNRAWLSLSHGGKSSTSKQQDLCFKGVSLL